MKHHPQKTPNTPRPNGTHCSGGPVYLPPMDLKLVARNEFFSAEALWRRRDGIWMCVSADFKLGWMKGMTDRLAAKFELIRRGCNYAWLQPPQPDPLACEVSDSPQVKTPKS